MHPPGGALDISRGKNNIFNGENLVLDGHPTRDYRNIKHNLKESLIQYEIEYDKINYETINNQLIEYLFFLYF